MRKFLTIASSLLFISSCGNYKSNNIHQLSIDAFYPTCNPTHEDFKQLNKQWSVSKLVDTLSFIQVDINSDGKEDFIGIFRPSEEIQNSCRLSYERDFTLFIDVGTTKPISTDFDIGYSSLPQLKKHNDGFSLTYQTGQSVKCDKAAIFKTKQMTDEIYLSKIQLLCFIPNSDVGWQTKHFEPNTKSLITNVKLPDLFADLESAFFSDVSKPTFTIKNKKAIVYKTTAYFDTTTDYFIQNDIINPIKVDGNWIYISYKNDTKFGWLNIDDLEVTK